MKQARGDVRQIIIGTYQTLERSGARDIVARVRKGVRAMGYSFSDSECSEWLKPFQHARARVSHGKRTENAPCSEHELNVKRTENARVSHSRANNESLVTKLSTSPPYPSDTTEPLDGETPPERSGEKPRRQRTESEVKPLELKARVLPALDDPSQPDWVVALRRHVPTFDGVPLRDLDVDQRFRIAMYHAWRWGNCTKDEKRNRNRAASICAGIANLSQHKQHGNLTLSEYIALGDECWKQRGMTPWYKPWDITGQIEPETPVERGAYARSYSHG